MASNSHMTVIMNRWGASHNAAVRFESCACELCSMRTTSNHHFLWSRILEHGITFESVLGPGGTRASPPSLAVAGFKALHRILLGQSEPSASPPLDQAAASACLHSSPYFISLGARLAHPLPDSLSWITPSDVVSRPSASEWSDKAVDISHPSACTALHPSNFLPQQQMPPSNRMLSASTSANWNVRNMATQVRDQCGSQTLSFLIFLLFRCDLSFTVRKSNWLRS